MTDDFSPKLPTDYKCDQCDYITKYRNDFKKHCTTRKHLILTSDCQKTLSDKKHVCECGNEYKHRQSLFNHKKICQFCMDNIVPATQNQTQNYDQPNKDNLIEYLIKENAEFKTLIMELVKKENNTLTNINSNNVNSNNKTFNLQFFLNEQCKDALNIGEFVDSIKVQLSDLETVGHIGYVEGVSKILIKNLNELDVVKRPIHCSDLKREVLYIKDDDKWSKENDDKLVIKKAIKDVANKNIRQINEWTNLNPDCKQSDSKKNDQYLKIVMNSMSGGSNEEQNHNIDKIIKNITKSVIIEK
jgi:hypothetical protein